MGQGSGERHEEEGRLVIVQVDHLSGELLGDALGRLWASGARNVQLLPTLAKKGRPGQIVMIDARARDLAAIEEALLAELGVTGWHTIETRHVCFATEIVTQDVEVRTPSTVLRAQVAGKRRRGGAGSVVPEHDSCVALREKLAAEANFRVPLRELIPLVREALNASGRAAIDLRGRALTD